MSELDLPDSATPASEFRRVREQGEVIRLPTTGRAVRMRNVTTAHLLRLGEIPDILAERVISGLYGPLTIEGYKAFYAVAERKDQALALLDSYRIVCTAALIEPRIVDKPEAELAAGEILIDDLEVGEQHRIFDIALVEATGLSRFRYQQETDVEPVDADEGDVQPTEPPGAD